MTLEDSNTSIHRAIRDKLLAKLEPGERKLLIKAMLRLKYYHGMDQIRTGKALRQLLRAMAQSQALLAGSWKALKTKENKGKL